MSDLLRCPDCGHENPAGSTSCDACNFPLAGAPGAPVGAPPARRSDEAAAAGSGPAGGPPAAPAIPRPLRPIRPRRPRPASNQALALWLTFGTLCALIVVAIAIKANVERASQPVEGSNETEQKRADEFRDALAKDSTNVDARVGLGDVLFDTGNWSEAIVQYRSAVHHDSTRVAPLVDLGVCYYNLGDTAEAERLFQLALARDPHQPRALFNLGIVSEGRSDFEAALQYFHRALQSSPPEEMQQPITEGMQRVMKKLGKAAPPLPGGS